MGSRVGKQSYPRILRISISTPSGLIDKEDIDMSRFGRAIQCQIPHIFKTAGVIDQRLCLLGFVSYKEGSC